MTANCNYLPRYKNKLKGVFFMLALCMITATGYARSGPFTSEAIPLVGDEVFFSLSFNPDLPKEELITRAFLFLGSGLNPHSASFLKNSNDTVICRVSDYLEISSEALSTFAMYMKYDLKLAFNEGGCRVAISNISFMEKSDFEKPKNFQKGEHYRELSGKDIMVDKNYSRLFKKDSSSQITDAAIKRFNEVVNGLERYFSG